MLRLSSCFLEKRSVDCFQISFRLPGFTVLKLLLQASSALRLHSSKSAKIETKEIISFFASACSARRPNTHFKGTHSFVLLRTVTIFTCTTAGFQFTHAPHTQHSLNTPPQPWWGSSPSPPLNHPFFKAIFVEDGVAVLV